MSRFFDAIVTYRILKKLSMPYTDMDAYKLGIIDANGNVLKKYRDLNTTDERDAYTILDRMIIRLRKIIHKVPQAQRTLATWAGALALIKEYYDAESEPIDLERRFVSIKPSSQDLQETLDYFENKKLKTFKMHAEEIANVVGGGFSGQATPNPNPFLAGRDIPLGRRIARRKRKPDAQT